MLQKKKLIFMLGLLVVILAAALFIGVNKGKKSEDTATKSPQSSAQSAQNNSALLGESFTDGQTGISMRIPRGWQLTPRNADDPGSLTKFVQSQAGSNATRANGELIIKRTTANIDDIVRPYLAAALDIDATPHLVDNQDERIGNRTVRVLTHEIPGPNGLTGRIGQYIFYEKGIYYILAYTMLSSDWPAQKPAVEASLNSLVTAKQP